ncbi:tetratricopeptide repeat protein, partial [Myxococcota bacterium]|nr:tetratricopeptide repeat protein [Myxococcota bacterium]
MRITAILTSLIFLTVGVSIPVSDVLAADERSTRSSRDKKKARPTGRMSKSPSKKTGKKLQEALELINEERYADARTILDQALRAKNLRPIDTASLKRFYGFTYTGNEQYLEGIPYFEEALALNVLSPKVSLDLQFNLAQLYMATEQFEKASDTLQSWIATSEFPEARAHYYLAVALTQQDRIDEALGQAKIAVDMSERPKEAWMRLLLNLYFQKQMYADMLPLLRYLVKYHPKKVYWSQLSAV